MIDLIQQAEEPVGTYNNVIAQVLSSIALKVGIVPLEYTLVLSALLCAMNHKKSIVRSRILCTYMVAIQSLSMSSLFFFAQAGKQ